MDIIVERWWRVNNYGDVLEERELEYNSDTGELISGEEPPLRENWTCAHQYTRSVH